jgi:hypothetical protein
MRALIIALALQACAADKVEPKPGTGKPIAGKPVISTAEAMFNFGKVEQGTTVEHVFKITNTGKMDLVIKKATGS